MENKKYQIIYADPPWKYKKTGGIKNSRGMAKQFYKTMTMEEICELPIKDILEESFEEHVIEIKGLREGLSRAILTVAENGKSNLETEDINKILYGPDELTKKLRSLDIPF